MLVILKVILAVLVFFIVMNWFEYKAIGEAYQRDGFGGAVHMVIAISVHRLISIFLKG